MTTSTTTNVSRLLSALPTQLCLISALLLVCACDDSSRSSGGDPDAGADTGGGGDGSVATCDDPGVVSLGTEGAFFLGDCGVAERSLEVAQTVGVQVELQASVAATLAITDGDDSEVLGATPTVSGALETALTLEPGSYQLTIETTAGTGGGTLSVIDACNASLAEIVSGDEVEGELGPGDCQQPEPSDLFVVRNPIETRYLFDLVSADFSGALQVIDEMGTDVASDEGSLDVMLPTGTYRLRVFDSDGDDSGGYTLAVSELDACDPIAIELNQTVTGTLGDADCADGSLRTDKYSLETTGLTLVRAEWVTSDGSPNSGDHAIAMTNNGVTSSSVRRTRRSADGTVVSSWVGVLDNGPHVWSVSRLFDGVSPPLEGLRYAGSIGEPPASHCTQQVDVLPVIADEVFRDQTLWDCQDDGRFVRVHSLSLAERTTVGVSLFAPEADGGMNIEAVSLSGSVIRSGFAFGDQIGSLDNLVLNPGIVWIVIRGADAFGTYTLSINLFE